MADNSLLSRSGIIRYARQKRNNPVRAAEAE
jgi:hypothetical protein